mmetsp:Transcript_9069/g.23200  ORF Transcript_9069/g.23200 Transcript_9069/m.23200 type:complete len:245 (-) Transcript_9069:347-1081(-)
MSAISSSSSRFSFMRCFSAALLDSSSRASRALRMLASAMRRTASAYCARTSSEVPRWTVSMPRLYSSVAALASAHSVSSFRTLPLRPSFSVRHCFHSRTYSRYSSRFWSSISWNLWRYLSMSFAMALISRSFKLCSSRHSTSCSLRLSASPCSSSNSSRVTMSAASSPTPPPPARSRRMSSAFSRSTASSSPFLCAAMPCSSASCPAISFSLSRNLSACASASTSDIVMWTGCWNAEAAVPWPI